MRSQQFPRLSIVLRDHDNLITIGWNFPSPVSRTETSAQTLAELLEKLEGVEYACESRYSVSVGYTPYAVSTREDLWELLVAMRPALEEFLEERHIPVMDVMVGYQFESDQAFRSLMTVRPFVEFFALPENPFSTKARLVS